MNNSKIMGILNVTPDSFSDGGQYTEIEHALKQVEKMIEQGASIIDVGGESTRPGAEFVEIEEEINRVVPIIKAIKAKYSIKISVDTYKSEVAEAAILAGADIVNDVWGNKYDGKMLDVVAKYHVPYIWMHNNHTNEYKDLLAEIAEDFNQVKSQLKKLNYQVENLIFDPGIGFAKTQADNLKVLANLEYFKELNSPMLLGTSRKSVFNYTLGIEKAIDRDIPTAHTTFIAVLAGYEYIRVHNVRENYQALVLAEKILMEK